METIQKKAEEGITSELALVQAAKKGDLEAFSELVRRYDRNVFRIAQHITHNEEDAQDVVQDAFLKAYQNLEQFQGNSKFYTWLVRIAVNEALMKLRKRRTDRTVSLDEDVETEDGSMPREVADWSPNPEQLYGQSELGDLLRKTIQGLPPGFRTVFVLRDVEGLSTEETAEMLGLSVPTPRASGKIFQVPEGRRRSTVKCTEFLQELSDYLDGKITESLKAELDEHLHWCHECHVVLNTTKKTIEIYRDNHIYELPDPLRTRLHDAIMTKCRASKTKQK
jgi:RNA polymerase sigma-70 factor (ECF subfamily)